MTLHVSSHAISRYRERVAPVDQSTAVAALRSPVITLAARIGAPLVRLPGGQRVVIEDGVVVTVLPKDHWTAALDRRRRHPHNLEGMNP